MPEFFSREIEVELGGELKTPVSFRLGGRTYEIEQVIYSWPDYGFGKVPLQRKRWWHRHHRNYYRVRTKNAEVFEIYHDRGTRLDSVRKGKWFLYRQI